ncbi:MAG: hypothetical protein WDA68_06435 [Phycisphaerae bacterium]
MRIVLSHLIINTDIPWLISAGLGSLAGPLSPAWGEKTPREHM